MSPSVLPARAGFFFAPIYAILILYRNTAGGFSVSSTATIFLNLVISFIYLFVVKKLVFLQSYSFFPFFMDKISYFENLKKLLFFFKLGFIFFCTEIIL